MKRKYRRVGFTAAQSAELWERWKKGEGLKSIGRVFGKPSSCIFEALRQAKADAWETVFELGRARRPAQESDLVPYWLFQGDAKIERHVPAMPFSREVERLHELRRSLAIYRMVFGQSRQEDLTAYLLANIPEGEQTQIVAALRLDLSPVNRSC